MKNLKYALSIVILLFVPASLNAIKQKFVCFVVRDDGTAVSESALGYIKDVGSELINEPTQPKYTGTSRADDKNVAIGYVNHYCQANLNFNKYSKGAKKQVAIYTYGTLTGKLIHSDHNLTPQSKAILAKVSVSKFLDIDKDQVKK